MTHLIASAAVALAAAVAAPAQMEHADGADHGMYVLPGPSTTSAAEQAYAERLLARSKRVASRWATPRLARRHGYRPFGSRPDSTKTVFHYNSAARLHDGRQLDPRRPESLVFWHRGPGDYVLVALMFRVPSGHEPPHPAGALMPWHVHYGCEMADMTPPGAMQGPCPADQRMRIGATAMAHVWFMPDLTHAFDIARPPLDALDPAVVTPKEMP